MGGLWLAILIGWAAAAPDDTAPALDAEAPVTPWEDEVRAAIVAHVGSRGRGFVAFQVGRPGTPTRHRVVGLEGDALIVSHESQRHRIPLSGVIAMQTASPTLVLVLDPALARPGWSGHYVGTLRVDPAAVAAPIGWRPGQPRPVDPAFDVPIADIDMVR